MALQAQVIGTELVGQPVYYQQPAEPVYYQQPAEPVYYQQPAATYVQAAEPVYYQQAAFAAPIVTVGSGALYDRTPFAFTADAEEIKKIEASNEALASAAKEEETKEAKKVSKKKGKTGCC